MKGEEGKAIEFIKITTYMRYMRSYFFVMLYILFCFVSCFLCWVGGGGAVRGIYKPSPSIYQCQFV